LLRVDNVVSRYGRIEVLHGVSIEVGRGEIVALVGSNGAGKTTLLRTLSGVQPMSSGTVAFEERSIGRLAPHRRVHLGIVQVPEGRQVFAPLSVEDNLRLGAWSRRDGDLAADLERIYGAYPQLAEKRRIAAGSLSGGQQQMLAMGRALMAHPKLLLLDEPSMGLAPVLVDQILDSIVAMRASGVTILLVEQNVVAALAIADRGYVIETGRIVLSGTGRDLGEDARLREAYLGL